MVDFLTIKQELVKIPLERVISLDQSPISNGITAMRPINKQHVDAMLEVEADKLPPVEVALIREGFILIDGYHRLERSKIKEETDIQAHVGTYKSEYQVLNAAFSANLKHGLPSNNVSRTAYALWLYITPDEHGTTLTMEEAATKAGISRPAVSRAYKKLQESQRLHKIQEGEDEDETTNKILVPGQKLAKALYQYFTEEYATFTDNIFDNRSEKIRATALTRYFARAKNVPQTVEMLRSLARSINTSADTLEQKLQ